MAMNALEVQTETTYIGLQKVSNSDFSGELQGQAHEGSHC